MMKTKICSIITTLFIFAACASQKKTTYDFPDIMAANIRVQYQEQCDKGKYLYDKNCSKCHNFKIKGKTYIPDFEEAQLVGYAIRTSNKQHEQNITNDSLMTTEELGLIMTFLSYKKRNEL